MMLKRVSSILALGACVVGLGCSHDIDGETTTPTVVAGLRYVNVVPDTGGMDIRVIDVVGDAPNTVNATFRTGGAPYGTAITGLPQHTAVLAGQRRIRAFMSSNNPAIATLVTLDTTLQFDANNNYTVYLWGYSRAAGTPRIQAMLVKDSVQTLTATQFAVRVIHLAPTMAPTFGAAAVDVKIDTLAAAATPVGAASFANVTSGQVTAYVAFTARPVAGVVPALNYRGVVTATGTLTPFLQADIPNGATGTATANPLGGDLVAGTAVSAIVVPPSVAGSQATVFAAPTVIYAVDVLPPRTAP